MHRRFWLHVAIPTLLVMAAVLVALMAMSPEQLAT
jgi:hypothetical protein